MFLNRRSWVRIPPGTPLFSWRRFMQPVRFVSPGRYAMCRRLFKRPLRTMRKLAFMFHETPTLDLQWATGELLHLDRPYASHWLWDRLLRPQSGARLKDGRLSFRIGTTEFDLPIDDHLVHTVCTLGALCAAGRSRPGRRPAAACESARAADRAAGGIDDRLGRG